MRNTVVTVLSLFILCTATFAQTSPERGLPPPAAVYVAGGVPDYMKVFFGKHLQAALINAGADVNDETAIAFLLATSEEQSKRSGNAINDSIICELGRNFNIRYICVASINPASGAFALSAYIISTKTGKSRYDDDFTGVL